MTSRIRKHAARRLSFDLEAGKAKRLAACNKFMRLESEMIEMRQRAGDSGIKVARMRSKLIDALLSELFAHCLNIYHQSHEDSEITVALIALGGYGRAELSPFSDIDLMFLYPTGIKAKKIRDLQQTMTDEILYILWDLGSESGSFEPIGRGGLCRGTQRHPDHDRAPRSPVSSPVTRISTILSAMPIEPSI